MGARRESTRPGSLIALSKTYPFQALLMLGGWARSMYLKEAEAQVRL
jgi:hypothetical protein